MKTLNNHLILFDAECPMCKVYTQAFVKTGMLDADGRAAYQDVPDSICPLVDRQRAVNEIALIDQQTGEVSYGIASLFKVIGNAFPHFQFLFKWRPFNWVMSKVYAFISYNRRVIIPAAVNKESYAIQPSFKLHYRVAYLLFTWLLTGLILTHYAMLLKSVVPIGNSYRELYICGGQIIFQGMVICCFAKEKLWSYLGNMMTVSFGGSLLLMVPLTVNYFFTVPAAFCITYFIGVAGLMFLEHMRRCKLLNLGLLLSITWVIYRLLLLILIYKFN